MLYTVEWVSLLGTIISYSRLLPVILSLRGTYTQCIRSSLIGCTSIKSGLFRAYFVCHICEQNKQNLDGCAYDAITLCHLLSIIFQKFCKLDQ